MQARLRHQHPARLFHSGRTTSRSGHVVAAPRAHRQLPLFPARVTGFDFPGRSAKEHAGQVASVAVAKEVAQVLARGAAVAQVVMLPQMPNKGVGLASARLNRDDLQRLQAEFTNYKRREGEAKAELMSLARQEVVRELLPLLDNIDRALAHLESGLAP